jgi:hypothetical protein
MGSSDSDYSYNEVTYGNSVPFKKSTTPAIGVTNTLVLSVVPWKAKTMSLFVSYCSTEVTVQNIEKNYNKN